MFPRRRFLQGIAALAGAPALALPLSGCVSAPGRAAPHVVVVGGGFGGATAARYLRLWSEGTVRVTLIERDARFVSCPLSNLVLGGSIGLDDLTRSYDRLRDDWGVTVVRDEVTAVDAAGRTVTTASGARFNYDRLVLSPGVDFIPGAIEGLSPGDERVPHAWKAGPQTALLRRQLVAMRAGGVYALHVPKAPYRCPPGPYERACVIADYLRHANPRAKVLVLDANPEIQSKKALFTAAFAEYKGLIEYRPNSDLRAVDGATRTAELEFERIAADVLNVLPPMRAGDLARRAGLPLINERWVDIDWLSYEARGVPGVHVLGDAVFAAPGMPKSGHMATQHARVAAAAILRLLAGEAPDPAPVVMNTCYSFVDARRVIHVASVHPFDPEKRQPVPVAGAGGVSAVASEAEGEIAWTWARNTWRDMLG
ncbi:NAD(P)/FAD-dependent oxidoreductase [Azoarcus olearius]|uniref:Probable sulfide dehydrogenase, flavoprtein subunit n=1 Tax=Azoarcus sp. (strain BH72) TaxID=418699 RepID=A1K4K3_AZOSB|nr:NAD(P)/FAD-dependent oxidoreductase [Azoarcus olearius]ANQ84306.1 sulfide dehydrogenase, flavoprtein subunit [Azoarcus olearius]CAL93758.1 probable sulfide dehydrogenase, flavoprtein subunit [Azoarcus olearius]